MKLGNGISGLLTRCWWCVCQGVSLAELHPLGSAELMEWQDFETLHVRHVTNESADRFDLFRDVCKSRDKHVADPCRPAQPCQPARKGQDLFIPEAGDSAVMRGVIRLQIENDEIDFGEFVIQKLIAEVTVCVQSRVQFEVLLGVTDEFDRERLLHERLSAGDREAAFCGA